MDKKTLDVIFDAWLKNAKVKKDTYCPESNPLILNTESLNVYDTVKNIYGEPKYEEGGSLLDKCVKQLEHTKEGFIDIIKRSRT
jgi:hypothetical protein